MVEPLTQALLRAAMRAGQSGPDGFEARLSGLCDSLPPAQRLEFASFLGARLEPKASVESITAWPIADLSLVFRCLKGDPRALSELDSTYFAALSDQLTRAGFSKETADETRLRVAEKVLVPSGGESARLGTFSGKSALGPWLRVVALREAMRVQSKTTREVDIDDLALELEAADEDPELRLFKKRFRSEFAEAFRSALDDMPADQRLILRQYFIDELSVHHLATIHHVHRATTARWVAHARAELVRKVKQRLQKNLGVDAAEVSRLVRAVRSGFDVSLRRFLG